MSDLGRNALFLRLLIRDPCLGNWPGVDEFTPPNICFGSDGMGDGGASEIAAAVIAPAITMAMVRMVTTVSHMAAAVAIPPVTVD